MKTTYKCNNCGTKGTPREFKTNSAETIRPVCPSCGKADNISKYVTGEKPVHHVPGPRFYQSGSEQFIRVGDKEVSFNLHRLSNAQLREVVNGVANILSSVAAVMDREEES